MIETTSNYLLHSGLAALLVDAWLKSLAVLVVAGGLCWLLRRASAASRHWVWLVAMASLPSLLLLATVPHSWQRPLWSVSTGFNSGNEFALVLNLAPGPGALNADVVASRAGAAAVAAQAEPVGSANPLAAHCSITLLVVVVAVWLIGVVVGLAAVLAGLVQLSRLAQTARVLHDADWLSLLNGAGKTLCLRRPAKLLLSADNPMPVTWGWRRPVVLLPAEAAQWTAERRRVVLLHELAHVKRWDCLTQTVVQVVCALFWVNPLVWLAARKICVERERACDDLVLNSGCKASDYATHLVDIARSFRRVPQFSGIAMARSTQLQGRIAAIVDATRARRLRPFTAVAILVLMGALALSVGGSSPAASRSQAEDSALRQQ